MFITIGEMYIGGGVVPLAVRVVWPTAGEWWYAVSWSRRRVGFSVLSWAWLGFFMVGELWSGGNTVLDACCRVMVGFHG